MRAPGAADDDAAGIGAGLGRARCDRPVPPVVRSAECASVGGPAPRPVIRPRVCVSSTANAIS